jgi:hypothetical protein
VEYNKNHRHAKPAVAWIGAESVLCGRSQGTQMFNKIFRTTPVWFDRIRLRFS